MIAPGIEIVDLDPDGFAHLCALMARRERARTQLQVLHDGGKVLRVVHSTHGALPRHREPFDDPHARAAQLLADTDVDQVVLLDRGGLDDLTAAVDALATPERTQPEMLWLANQTFWSHPCVACAPAPPPSRWPAIQAALRSLGDDYTAVLGVWRGDDPFLTLVGRVTGGILVSLTSAHEPPPRSRAPELVERLERERPVPLAALCDLDVLDAVVLAEDVVAAARTADWIFERGGEALWAPAI